jgi:hypothetical protein
MDPGVRRFTFALSALLVAVGCNSQAPPTGPEAICARACEASASRCTHHQCSRGCNLILDRLAEGEGDHVVACVAKTSKTCDDRAWAHCAVRIGIHVDGGPPAPAPPSDEEDDQE